MGNENSSVLFREESRLPRWLTWPLVFLSAGAIASGHRKNPEIGQGLFLFYVFAGALFGVFLVELIAVTVVVTTTEVRFWITPFYRRKIVIANILHWEVRTYPGDHGMTRYFWRSAERRIELTMKDGSRFAITSEHAEQFSHAMNRAKEMAGEHDINPFGHRHHGHH